NLATICEEVGLRPYVDALVDSTVVGVRKPEPEIFHHALTRLGLAPGAVVFVGDSLGRDLAGARGVGMPHVWLTAAPAADAGGGSLSEPCGPGDAMIHALGELDGLLP